MPAKSLKPCMYPLCSGTTPSRYCDKHKHLLSKYDKQHDLLRGTAHQRGYGVRWQRYRLMYLKSNPLCVMCKPRLTQATVVDHIVPVESRDDPLFYAETNHQALCRQCHGYKTRVIDKRGFGSVKR